MKIRRIKYILFAPLIFLMILSSCTPPLYNTNKLHAPMLMSKGDFQAEGSWGLLQGANAACTYALTNNFALTGSASFGDHQWNDSSFIHQKAYELGFGIFGFLGEKTPWEAYLTFMNAKSNVAGPENTLGGNVNVTRVWSDYWRLSLQGNMMTNQVWIKERKILQGIYLDHALGARLSYVNFFNYHEIRNNDIDKTVVIDNISPKLLTLEISSILKFGVYPLFIEVQYGIVLPLFRSKGQFDYVNPNIFSIGASLCFY